MSTSNFYKLHASAYYVVNSENLWQFETDKPANDYNRSYPGMVYQEKREEGPYIMQGYVELDIRSQKIIRSGYYCDSNLDFDIVITAPFAGDMYLSSYDSIEDMADEAAGDIIDYLMTYEGLNAGLAAIHGKAIASKIEKCIETLTERLDKELKEDTDDIYNLSALFSNGEAVYTKAS